MPVRWNRRTALLFTLATALVMFAAIWLVIQLDRASQRTAIDATPPTPDHYAHYTYQRTQGQFQQALYHLQRVAENDGWSSVRLIEMGNLWRDMGDIAQALAYWQASADTDANLLRQIADAQLTQGQFGAAQQTLALLLDVAPDDAWGHYNAGLLLAPSDPASAQRHLSRVATHAAYGTGSQRVLAALFQYDNDPLLSAHVGATLAELERYAFAENAFVYAAGFQYPFAEALAYAGLMQDFQGKDGGAYIRRAIDIAPANADVRYVQALHLRQQANYDGSVLALRAALALEPDNAIYHVAMGQTQQQMGDITGARLWYEAAVNISDDDPQIQAVLDTFYADEAAMLPEEWLEVLLP